MLPLALLEGARAALGSPSPALSCAPHAASIAPSSLVFEMEEVDEEPRAPAIPQSKLDMLLDAVRDLTSPETVVELRLMRDVRAQKAALVAEEGAVDVAVLAASLARVGYDTTIRAAVGGGDGAACFANLRHEFILVAPPTGAPMAAEPLIVEPMLREHFEIPSPTPLYDAVLAALPREFVGPAPRLAALVSLLAAEMLDAFHAQGLPCPPWRKARAMLSKWLPAPTKRLDRGPECAHGAGGESPPCGASPPTLCTLADCALCKSPRRREAAAMAAAPARDARAAPQGHATASGAPPRSPAPAPRVRPPTRQRSLLSSSLAALAAVQAQPTLPERLSAAYGAVRSREPAAGSMAQFRTIKLCG